MCHLDPMYTQLVKSSLDFLLPVLVKIINTSLSSSLKSVTITHLFKRSILNHEDLKNCRPISNLIYISKLIEKIATDQFYDEKPLLSL